MKDKKYCKVRDNCHSTAEDWGAGHSMCNLKYDVPKSVPTDSQDGSNYDYHFIIKEFVEKLKDQFTCLGENIEKYITFTVPIENEVRRIDKNGEEM